MKNQDFGQHLLDIENSKTFCYVTLVLTIVMGGIAIYIKSYSTLFPLTVTLIFAISALSRPTMKLYEKALVRYALIGPKKFITKFDAIDKVKYENKKIVISGDDQKKTESIKVYPSFVEKDSIEKLTQVLS